MTMLTSPSLENADSTPNTPLPVVSAQLRTVPSANDFVDAAARRNKRTTWLAVLVSLACGFGFVAFGLDSPMLPVILLIGLAFPVLLWHYNHAILYIVFAAVCLFEMAQTGYADALTDRVPFFWNVNTVFQILLHINLKAVPFNVLEILVGFTGVVSLLRAVVMRRVSLRGGPLIVPIGCYIGFVTMAWINGMATGGDFKLSLQETRAQFYLFMAYLMGYNLLTNRRHIDRLVIITAVCIALKGVLYTFRRYVTMAGLPVPDQGVGSHEEAFLFDAYVALVVTCTLCGVYKKVTPWMWAFLPLVILGNLATNRRAATAALVIVVPAMLLALYRVLPRPRQKRAVAWSGIVLAVGGFFYYQAFKNSDSMIAQPARAIRSQFQPDDRDASSNAYRDAENADIIATIRLAPLQGYGYGKRMLHAVPIADISSEYEWWDLLPHNQILWVWMRVGTVGFWVFWMMVSAILLYLSAVVRVTKDATLQAIGIFTLLVVAMLMIFGLLDLQLSNFRDMLFVGFWIGTACAFARITNDESHIRTGILPRETGPLLVIVGESQQTGTWSGSKESVS